jgi:hypothetical protein
MYQNLQGRRDDWIDRARRELLGLRSIRGGWGYRLDSEPCVEPTALAALALLATSPGGPAEADVIRVIREASDSVVHAQRLGGVVGVSATRANPGWMTPHALLLWTALGMHQDRAERATSWLLAQKGTTLARSDDPAGIAGHDTTLVGWPWVSETHSWLEPTVLAVLSLTRAGQGAHPRVREGLQLIRDRSVPGGGWNYGNKAVFGHPLRAQPAPTGLGLLALSGVDARDPAVDLAVTFLRELLPTVRAAVSLGWGLLGLRAWGETPEGSDRWLAESYSTLTGRPDAVLKLACLLLAVGEESGALLGRSIPRVSST